MNRSPYDAIRITPPGHIELSAKEERTYNPLRAMLSISEGSWQRKGSLEKEASDAIEQRLGKPSRGFYMPMNVRASVTGNVTGTASLGGNLVETQVFGFADLLRAKMVTRAAGVTVLSGLTGPVKIPRRISENVLSWSGENPPTANPLTESTFDQVSLSPKTAMASTAYSRNAMIQTSPDIASLAIQDLAAIAAIGLDSAVLNGTGLNNQPTGVRATTGVNTKAIGTNGGNLTWAIVVGAETEISIDNADGANMVFVTTPGVRGSAKQILKSTTSGSQFLWEQNDFGHHTGYATSLMPSNLTKGTSTTICHAAILGDWGQVILAEFGGALDILINPYTYADQGMIAVHAFLLADVAVRQPTALCLVEDILI